MTHIAEHDLQFVEPRWSVHEARRWLVSKGFDAAPLREPEPHRFIQLRGLKSRSGTVRDVARPIDAPRIVTSNLGLADGIARLRRHPFYFVIEGSTLSGIVSRADLQRPPVGMVVLSLILAAEVGINQIVEARLDDSWLGRLSDDDREEVEKIYADRKRHNAEISPLQCLLLHHRLDLLVQCPGALVDLGFESKTAFRKWKSSLGKLRNVLAHGGTMLDAESDPSRAIDLFLAVRRFTEAVWEQASSTHQAGRSSGIAEEP